jgi:hypothetical protein
MRLILPIVCAIAAIGFPAVLAGSSSLEALRRVLTRWQFWTLELQFVVLVLASWHEGPRLARAIAAPPSIWLGAGGCVALALVLTTLVAPRTSRIYFDEQIYQSIGQSLADERLAQMCNDGVVEYGRLQCRSGEYNKQPYGYPYLLSLAYRAAGVDPRTAHVLNNAAFGALVLVVFLLGTLAFGSAAVGLGAALVMALVPIQILWSNTAAVEPTAALMCGVALVSAFHFARSRTSGALVWCLASLVFAASFRPECVLVVPLVAAIVLTSAPRELLRARTWWAAGIAGLAGWNVLAHTVAVRSEPWGATGPRMSLDFLETNLRTNTLFYIWDERFPVVFTALALAGLWSFRRRVETWIVGASFLVCWGVFLGFYAGSYDYGADVRYSLMSYAPLAVLSGAGLARAATWSGSSVPRPRAAAAIAAALLFHWLLYLPLVRAVGEEAWGARADVAFVERILPDLPANAVVLTQTPSTFFVRGVNAVQTSIAALDPNRMAELFERFGGGVYLHWGFWCNVADPVQQTFCATVRDRHSHRERAAGRERTYRFALYELLEPDHPQAAREGPQGYDATGDRGRPSGRP